jgi:hypothetical protein
MIDNRTQTNNWPELAESLYSFLTGRGATIEYSFDNVEVWVPSSTHAESPSARWKVNGTVRIRTSEAKP